ncbi:MAG TPA: tetratricopeptide repeat protein [Nitrospiria bacterium]
MKLRQAATVFILIGMMVLNGCFTMSQAERDRKAQAFHKIGISYLNENQNQRAYIQFQKAIKISPKHKESQYGIGHVFFMQGKYKEAVEAFQAAVSIDSTYSEAHNYMGKAYEALGESAKAVSEYQKALANPQYETPHFAHFNIGLIHLNASRYKDAAKEFRAAAQVAPDYAVAYSGLGQAYLRDGYNAEAIEAFSNAVRIAPEYTEAYFYLGQAHAQNGDSKSARQAYEKVVKISPDSDFSKKAKLYIDKQR